ncbi:MAG: hypothetical protein ACE5I7_11930 [Candidatus Binatia bacterium]
MWVNPAGARAMVEPDIVLPAQFFAGCGGPEQPEKRLMLAVLEEAVLTFLKHAGGERIRSRRLVREVEEWIDTRDSAWPFSFEGICVALSLDAEALRRGLRCMPRRSGRRKPAGLPAFGRRVAGERHRVTIARTHHQRSTARA